MGEGIPEWVLWGATAIGTALGALIIRLGWKSGPAAAAQHKPVDSGNGHDYIDKVGVLVDNKAIALLSGSIEGSTLERITLRKAFVESNERNARVGNRIADELEELRTDIRDLSRALRDRR